MAAKSKPGHAAVERAQRLLGRLRAHLEYAPVEDIVADLDAEMTRVQDVCADVAGIVATAFFAAADAAGLDQGRDPLMRISIDHQTGFRYSSPVASSYNEARMTPATTSHQTVWTSRVSDRADLVELHVHRLLGHPVTTFELHEPHKRLTVHAQSVVETRGDEQPWDQLDRCRATISVGRR